MDGDGRWTAGEDPVLPAEPSDNPDAGVFTRTDATAGLADRACKSPDRRIGKQCLCSGLGATPGGASRCGPPGVRTCRYSHNDHAPDRMTP